MARLRAIFFLSLAQRVSDSTQPYCEPRLNVVRHRACLGVLPRRCGFCPNHFVTAREYARPRHDRAMGTTVACLLSLFPHTPGRSDVVQSTAERVPLNIAAIDASSALRGSHPMTQIATIRYDGGALVIPARDPYERELVFEEADFYARRHGMVGLQLGRNEMRVSRSAAELGLSCGRCGQPLRMVTFQLGERRFCTRCAKYAAR